MKLYVKIIQNPDCVNWDYSIDLDNLCPTKRQVWNKFLKESKFLTLPNNSQFTDPGYRYSFNIDYYVVTLLQDDQKHQVIVSDPGCNQALIDQIKTLMSIF